MKLKRVLALGLAAMSCFGFCGCELASVNTERDNAQIVLEIGDRTYTKEYLNYIVSSQLQMTGASSITEEEYNQYALEIVESFAKAEALKIYAIENGFEEKLTEADKADIAETYNQAVEYYNEGIAEAIEAQWEQDGKLTTDNQKANMQKEVEKEKDVFLRTNGISKIEEYEKIAKESKILEIYRANLVNSISVTQDQVEAKYNQLLKDQKSAYTSDPSQYLADADTAGEIILYVPAGFRKVQHVLIKFDEETEKKVTDLQTKINAASSDSDKKKLEAELETVKNAGYAKIQKEADEVLKYAKQGESFGYLISKYNDDEGMTDSPGGYYVHEKLTTRYVEEFQNSAMALKKVGDISDLVKTEYGYHILRYASEIKEETVPLSTYQSKIKSDLLEERQNNVVTEKMTEVFDKYKQEGKLVIHEKRMAIASVPGK